MSRHVPFVLLFAVAALTACKPSTPEAAPLAGNNADAQTAAAEAAPAAVLPEGLKAGMRFSEARTALAVAGWLPLQDRGACMTQVGDRSAFCFNTPELASCGQQSCTLDFANADALQRLSLVVDAPAASGPEEVPVFGAVKSWVVSEVAAAKAADTCPASDFDGFLKAFAGDPQVRALYTAPLVRVAQLIDRGERGYQPQETLVAAATYSGFLLNYREGAWYPSAEEGAPRTAPLDVRITAESGGSYYVTVPGNVEGISYRFEPHGSCWRLAADPDAAAS